MQGAGGPREYRLLERAVPLRTGSSSQHSQHLGQHTCASVYGQRSPELFATIFLHLCVNAASLSSRASAVTNSEKVKNVNLGCGRCETDARSLRHPVLGFRGPGYTESAALGYSSHKRHSRSTRKKFTNLLSIVGTFLCSVAWYNIMHRQPGSW